MSNPCSFALEQQLELDFRGFIVCCALFSWNLKHRLFAEPEHACDEISRESLDSIVELFGCRIEETAGSSELILDVR